MLDINLGDRTSFVVADRLMDLNIPFLFATGYGEQARCQRIIAAGLRCRSPIRWRMSRGRWMSCLARTRGG